MMANNPGEDATSLFLKVVPLIAILLVAGCGGGPASDADPTPLVEPSGAPPRPTVPSGRRITSSQAAPVQIEASTTFLELAGREQSLAAGQRGLSAAPLPQPASSAPPAELSTPALNETQASPLVTPAAAGPSPAAAASFQALLDNLSSFPPDTNGAAGPNHLMVTLNTQVAIQTRAGAQLSVVSLLGFWSPVYSGSNIFDPSVVYDPSANRWMVTSATDEGSPSSSVLIAVSKTSDPTAGWNMFRFDADPAHQYWADSPRIGFNKSWIVVTAFRAPNSPDGSFGTSDYYVCNKAALYAGTGSCRLIIANAQLSVPPRTYDNSLDAMYMVRDIGGGGSGSPGRLAIDTIGGPIGSEVLTTDAVDVTMPQTWGTSPALTSNNNFGPQLGTTQRIDTGDSMHTLTTVVRNGSIWGAHAVFLPQTGPTHVGIDWWQISPTGAIQQFGRFEDMTATKFFSYPSLAVNMSTDVLIGYTSFSQNQYASAGYAFRAGSDPLNLLRSDTLLKAGRAPYVKIDPANGLNRWGDYSNTVVDPLNDTDFWTIQEYAETPSGSVSRWGTWWGKVVPPSGVDRTEGGTATATGAPCNASSETVAKAYDNSMTSTNFSKWCVTSAPTATVPISTVYDFSGTTAFVVTRYTITTGNDDATRDPKDWKFQGCKATCSVGADSGWTTLDARAGEFNGAARLQSNSYTFSNTTAYQQYRLRFTANHGNASRLQMTEIQMF